MKFKVKWKKKIPKPSPFSIYVFVDQVRIDSVRAIPNWVVDIIFWSNLTQKLKPMCLGPIMFY